MTNHHKGPPAGLAGTTDHIDAGNGWLIVRLLTKQALLREGEHMDHCVGDGGYEDLTGDEDLTSDAIWSLRDPDGVSRVTLDVRAGADGRRHVLMAKGPRNRDVRRSDARRLQALVMTFRGAGVPLDFAGETRLVMADDGRVMREDQAPEEVREQARARQWATRAPGRSGLLAQALMASMTTHLRMMRRLTVHLPNGGTLDLGTGTLSEEPAVGVDTQTTPPTERTMVINGLRAGHWYNLLDEFHVTDVTVSAGDAPLREGEDFTVDNRAGLIEALRDIPGEVTISFRVTIGVDTQAPRYGAGGFPGGGGGGGVSRWSAEELRDILTVDSVTVGEGRGFPGGGGGSGVAVSRGGVYVIVPTRNVSDFLSLQKRTGPGE